MRVAPTCSTKLACRSAGSICDEDNPEALIGVGPAFELHRRMEHMMDAVNGDRRMLADQIDDAFDAQEILVRAFT
jgi:hypothetical protein